MTKRRVARAAAVDNPDERWREIPGYPDYEASSLGRIRRLTRCATRPAGYLLKPALKRDGYLVVCLTTTEGVRHRRVHRLVTMAFHGLPPSPDHVAAHKDDCPTNNVPGNLRWATLAENAADAIRNGRYRLGERHHNARLTPSLVLAARAARRAGRPCAAIARTLGVSPQAVKRAIDGVTWAWLSSTEGSIS